jgi:hypothetical protein
MNEDQIAKFSEVLTSANDMLETAQRIKGEQFASAAGHLFEVMQLVELVTVMGNAIGLETAQKYIDVAMRVMDSLSQHLVSDLTETDALEAIRLAEQLAERQSEFHDLLARG